MRATSKTKWTTAFLVLVCLLVAALPCFQFSPVSAAVDGHADYVSTDTREGRLAVFDNVWETIDERYYDPHFGGIDWNAPRMMFRQAAADARGSYELYEVLRRMVASLRDPHTRVYSPEEKFDWWNPRFVSVGLTIREIEGVPTVVQVDPKSDPARAGIRAGDQLESIDGVSASSLATSSRVLMESQRRIWSSNESGQASRFFTQTDQEGFGRWRPYWKAWPAAALNLVGREGLAR